MYILHIFLFSETAASAAFQRPSTENMKTPMNNEIAVTEWKREYCGTDDFKGTPVRIFKVEAGLSSTYDLQAAARGVENNNVKEEWREAAVPLSKASIVMGKQEDLNLWMKLMEEVSMSSSRAGQSGLQSQPEITDSSFFHI